MLIGKWRNTSSWISAIWIWNIKISNRNVAAIALIWTTQKIITEKSQT